MARKVVKTLQGKSLDLDELKLRNEKTQPVGNKHRGKAHAGPDVDFNDTVASGTRRPNKSGRRASRKVVEDAPVMNSLEAAKILARRFIEMQENGTLPGAPRTVEPPKETPRYAKPTGPAPKPTAKKTTPQTATVKPEPVKPAPAPVEVKAADEVSDNQLEEVIERITRPSGLAGAIARAREVKQEPLKTPREQQRGEDGVKKI